MVRVGVRGQRSSQSKNGISADFIESERLMDLANEDSKSEMCKRLAESGKS